ncbi:MAG: inositol monophosphatase [Devosiaceae bacterium]|nr:inositol monophosphatase [Devosiaceae bacterium]
MAASALLNIMVKAAQKAGRSLTRDFGEVENLQVSKKGPADFVSNADLKAEEIIHAELIKARPTYSFLMEEGGEIKGSDGQHRWIIDPLDGTTNFLHGIPMFASCIALERNGEIVASVIYNPIMEETFTAERGGGAWLNERKRLRVAGRRKLVDCVAAAGINSRSAAGTAREIKQLAHIAPSVAGIRRSGSACLDLAWLAAGRYDLYWEADLKPWDIAPGSLLIKEAGGFISDFAGKPNSIVNGEVVAGNELVQGALLKALKKIST